MGVDERSTEYLALRTTCGPNWTVTWFAVAVRLPNLSTEGGECLPVAHQGKGSPNAGQLSGGVARRRTLGVRRTRRNWYVRHRSPLEDLERNPSTGRRRELPRTLAAARRQADLPPVAVQLVNAEVSIALLGTFLEVQVEALGHRSLVDGHRSFTGRAHGDGGEAIAAHHDPRARTGHFLPVHFQRHDVPGPLQPVEVLSHECPSFCNEIIPGPAG